MLESEKKYSQIKTLVDKIGHMVYCRGWVRSIRDLGSLKFIDLRDLTGVIQCVVEKSSVRITQESVIEVVGYVKLRSDKSGDIMLKDIEIFVHELNVINLASPLPIHTTTDGYEIKEEVRLKYRYLDLRRDRLQRNIKLRSNFVNELRGILLKRDFIEIETPVLTASTMEGARDFVVPSRLNPGKFYALPQSPQQYKQMLMVAGFEKYFQIARCFRDENLRADRGFEFTQIDLEMSFVSQQDVMNLVESMLIEAIEKVDVKILSKPFPVFTYDEAMKNFGADKFDLRNEEEKQKGVLAFAWVINFPFFKRVDKEDVAEVRDGKSGWTFTHNPFSAPIPEHEEWHLKGQNIEKIITQQYDLVCNGYEVGGGSIRTHKPEILKATYKIMGYDEDYLEKSIGHLLDAFSLGTPPHGGIALGLDRLVAILANENSIKEVIAFPMTYQGRTAVTNAPHNISNDQLTELGLKLAFMEIKSGVDLDRAIEDLIKSQGFYFQRIEHPNLSTTEDHHKANILDINENVKSLILKGKKSNKNYLFVIPAANKLDKKEVKNALGEDFEFERPEFILKQYGLEVGGIAPFGNLINLPIYYCSTLDSREYVNFSTGLKTTSLRMKTNNFKTVLGDLNYGKWSDL